MSDKLAGLAAETHAYGYPLMGATWPWAQWAAHIDLCGSGRARLTSSVSHGSVASGGRSMRRLITSWHSALPAVTRGNERVKLLGPA